MSKRQVWVVEAADRGEDNWRPLKGESFTSESDALRNLHAFQEPYRPLWEYRIAKYVPEKP